MTRKDRIEEKKCVKMIREKNNTFGQLSKTMKIG